MPLVPLRLDDLEAARAVYNHWVATSTATFHADPLGPEEFAAEVVFPDSDRHGAWVVPDGDGGFAGYVVLAPYKSRCAYRDTAEVSVYLRPEATGRGLAGPAVEAVERYARERGLRSLLAVVCAENAASLRLFGRLGFAEVGRLREVGEKFGRHLDVVLLQKALSVASSA